MIDKDRKCTHTLNSFLCISFLHLCYQGLWYFVINQSYFKDKDYKNFIIILVCWEKLSNFLIGFYVEMKTKPFLLQIVPDSTDSLHYFVSIQWYKTHQVRQAGITNILDWRQGLCLLGNLDYKDNLISALIDRALSVWLIHPSKWKFRGEVCWQPV